MSHSVIIYCPDRHVLYEGSTPDRKGIGGGITSRLRLSQALAAQGSKVTVVANVPRPHTYKGVRHVPLDQAKSLKSDVVILSSTGGALDLRPVLDLQVECRLTEVRVGGVSRVNGLNDISYDRIVVPSNFIRQVVVDQWQIPADRVFVAYNGLQRHSSRFTFGRATRRDPFRLVYTSHPCKGLDSALAVLRLLREEDSRFQLHIYGGNKLWGGEDQPPEPKRGVFYHGMIGQRQLAQELKQSSVAMHLQSIPEASSNSLIEAMAAGNVVVASQVGSYGEIVRHGYDGFVIPGNHEESETRLRVAALIIDLVRRSDFADYIRRNAMSAPLDWDTIAKTWQGHWKWILDPTSNTTVSAINDCGGCLKCGGTLLPLADGYHCVNCGFYNRSIRHN